MHTRNSRNESTPQNQWKTLYVRESNEDIRRICKWKISANGWITGKGMELAECKRTEL